MLKGIHSAIGPSLLKVLAEMGHGEEIILADAHFPGHSFNDQFLRADGVKITTLLDGILPLFELDSYDDPLIMMQVVEGDSLDPSVESSYRAEIEKHVSDAPEVIRIGRFEFYNRAEKAAAVVMTGETAKYGNIILKKGVTPTA